MWQKHLLQKNTKRVLKSFVPCISLQRIQDAECRHFSAINFSAFYFPGANLPEFRLQPWVAGEARVGLLEVIRLVEEPASKAGGDEQSVVGSSPTASALLKVKRDSKNRRFATKKHTVNGIERSENPCTRIVSAEIVSSF